MADQIVMPFVENLQSNPDSKFSKKEAPNPLINYAADDTVIGQMGDLSAVMDWCRSNRQSLEEEWREILRMEMLQFDYNKRYKGRSSIYVPLFIKINQTLVSTLSRGLFPSDEYMNVADESENPSEGNALAVKALLQREFDYSAGLRKKIKPGLAQLNRTGNTVFKYWWHKNSRDEKRKQIRPSPSLKAAMGGALPKKSISFDYDDARNIDGLRFSPRSIFNFYLWPTTAESLEDATVVFEDIDTPRQVVEAKLKSGEWSNGEVALGGSQPIGHLANQAELHGTGFNLSAPSNSIMDNNKFGHVLVISEVWVNLVLPNSAYVGDEERGTPVPCKVIMCGRTPLDVRRNPFFHQRPPYLMGRSNVIPGLTYGYGTGRIVKQLQWLSNDFMNQTNDVLQYGLNPILKYNPAFLTAPLKPLSPGVAWGMTDIQNGAAFERPPADLGNIGIEAFQLISGQAYDFSGAPPVLQGTSAGKAARTATGAQILQKNAMSVMQDVVEDLEQEMMIPLMHGTWFLLNQYMDESTMVSIGGQPTRVDPEQLAINPRMTWMASSQAANQAQRSQQAIQFLQAILPLLPVLQSQGTVFNPVPLLRRVYTDMGMRDFASIFKEGVQQAAVGPGSQGSNPDGASQQQGDMIRSALDQLGGGTNDMVQGEGEDFQDVRDQTEAMTGLMGGGNGQ